MMDAASVKLTKLLMKRMKVLLELIFPSDLWMDFKLFRTLITTPHVEENVLSSFGASTEEDMIYSKRDMLAATGQILLLLSFLIRSSGRIWDIRHNLDA